MSGFANSTVFFMSIIFRALKLEPLNNSLGQTGIQGIPSILDKSENDHLCPMP